MPDQKYCSVIPG